jgi:preprotein translocase subunit SecG
MLGILTGLHIVVCVLLIMIVLLQAGKGAEMGAAFGGGYSQTIFGSAGPVSFLNKLTTVVAVFFMLTSLLLAFVSTQPSGKTVMDNVPQQEAPVPLGTGGKSD